MDEEKEQQVTEEEEVIDLDELTDEETQVLFNSVLDNDGCLALNRVYAKPIPKQKDKDKYYFAGTITGYEDKFDRPVYFEKGAHEEALPYWRGKKFLLAHEDKSIPLGKFQEAFMDGDNVKVLGWTDDKEYYEAVKTGKMLELSGNIIPKKVIFNKEKKKFGIVKYRPKEGSAVNFQGYEPAKIEIIGKSKDKVRNLLMEKTDETNLLQKDEQGQKFSEEKSKEQKFKEEKFEEKDKKILELERELKVMKFKEKHPKAINLDKIIEMMLKYEVSEEDAEEMIIVEEVTEIEEPHKEVKEEGRKISEKRENKELPRVAEEVAEIPKEKTELEKFRETLDERVEHAFRRGYK